LKGNKCKSKHLNNDRKDIEMSRNRLQTVFHTGYCSNRQAISEGMADSHHVIFENVGCEEKENSTTNHAVHRRQKTILL